MERIVYNKLIRDKIPEIIEESGKDFNLEIMNNNLFKEKINEKILEEIEELLSANDKAEMIDELADVFEILDAFMLANEIDLESVLARKNDKKNKRGAFENKLLLIDVEK